MYIKKKTHLERRFLLTQQTRLWLAGVSINASMK